MRARFGITLSPAGAGAALAHTPARHRYDSELEPASQSERARLRDFCTVAGASVTAAGFSAACAVSTSRAASGLVTLASAASAASARAISPSYETCSALKSVRISWSRSSHAALWPPRPPDMLHTAPPPLPAAPSQPPPVPPPAASRQSPAAASVRQWPLYLQTPSAARPRGMPSMLRSCRSAAC